MPKSIVFVLLLSGCAMSPPMTISQAQSLCGERMGFVGQTACIEELFRQYYPNWRTNGDGALMDIYFKWRDAATDRVQAGTLSDTDAQLQASLLFNRLHEISAMRSASAQEAARAQVMEGLAIMQSAQPRPGTICSTQQVGQMSQTVCN